MNWISKVYATAKGHVASASKLSAEQQPDLRPIVILNDADNNSTFNSEDFKNGEASLHSKLRSPSTFEEREAITVVQRGLIELKLINVDMTRKSWWKKFSWGIYGPATTLAVKELQKLAGIKNGRGGMVFGPDTLDVFRTALEAEKKGQDWKVAVK
jgi:hypothetical protein